MASGRKEYTIFWIIENYSYCWHKHDEKLVSPHFTANALDGLKAWHLELYPRRSRGYVSLYLQRSASDDEPEYDSIHYELSFLAADGSVLCSMDDDHSFKRYQGCGGYDFLKMDEILLQRNFPQDILTVCCKICRGEGDIHRVAPVYVRTRIGIEKISYLHEVENFSSLENKEKHTIEIRSYSKTESFASGSLYYKHESSLSGEMRVQITPSDNRHVLSKLEISLLDRSGNAIICAKDDTRFDVERKGIPKLPLSLTRQEILNKKSEYLTDDKLSLQCECIFTTGLELNQIEETGYKMPMAPAKAKHNQDLSKNNDETEGKASAYPSALEDIKTLYVTQCLTDVKLKTKTKSFPAHKIVLCARSPVFKRMMTIDMKEKNTDCIEVDDLEDDVVQQLLLFLYSDTVEGLEWSMATRLYYAADKYEVAKLKAVCSSFLVEHLTPTNAGELLLLADTHSDGDLKRVVEDFILDHERAVFGSKEWEMLMETNPVLVMKAMHLKYKR